MYPDIKPKGRGNLEKVLKMLKILFEFNTEI